MRVGAAMAGGMAEGAEAGVPEEKEGEERRGGSGVIRERSQISNKETQVVIKYIYLHYQPKVW